MMTTMIAAALLLRSRADSEPVWPSGKALGWLTEGPRFDTASALLSLQKGCGLSGLSCDPVCPSLSTETLKWLSSLPILMQESFWW